MNLLPIILPAWLAAALLAMLAAPLGCLVLWRRLAFFCDTLAHGAMLGAALALWVGVPSLLGMGILAVVLLFLVHFLHDSRLPNDGILAAVSAFLLSLGMVALGLLPQGQARVLNYLFGNLITVTHAQIFTLGIGTAVGLGLLYHMWRAQVMVALHADLASVDGIHIAKMRLFLLGLLAGFCTLAVPLVGSLLVGALLVLPALCARLFAHSPSQMARLAIIIAQIGVGIGIWLSAWWDIGAGLGIVLCLASVFLACFVWRRQRKGHPNTKPLKHDARTLVK